MYTGYVSLDFAESYFQYRLGTRYWDRATDDTKRAAMQMASDAIDTLPLIGYKREATQERRFPRDIDSSNDVPEAVMHATLELALEFLKGVDPQEEYNLLSLREAVYGSIRERRQDNFVAPHIAAGIPSLRAFTLLVPYLRDENIVALERG